MSGTIVNRTMQPVSYTVVNDSKAAQNKGRKGFSAVQPRRRDGTFDYKPPKQPGMQVLSQNPSPVKPEGPVILTQPSRDKRMAITTGGQTKNV